MRFVHYCQCGAWGAFGYGLPVTTAIWYCAAHRPAPAPIKPKAAPMLPECSPSPMPQDDGAGPRITIGEVAQGLKLKLPSSVAWSIGAEVREIYERRYGKLPPKDLRVKANDHGSHCFATYPAYMREQIAKIIKAHQVETERQGSLF